MNSVLKQCWGRGLNALLYFGKLSAGRDDGAPLTESDRTFIRMNKKEIIGEIKNLTSGQRVSFDQLLEDRATTLR